VEAALEECFSGRFGLSGRRVVLEELLHGPELSLFVLTDGVESLLLPSAMDYKRAFDGDKGLNSGGMGSVAPAPGFTAEIKSAFISTILEPTLKGLREEALYFRGVLFFGLILTENGPKLLEYNVRFGDPETQSLMPILPDNFLDLLLSCARGTLEGGTCEPADAASACTVVAVTADYPESSGEAVPVTSLPVEDDHLVAFVAGAAFSEGGQNLVSCGGRVVSVTAWGDSREEAVCAAYRGMEKVSFPGMRWRRDIGGGCSSSASAASQPN
jgi:phosphoribosylamine---glycine ligase